MTGRAGLSRFVPAKPAAPTPQPPAQPGSAAGETATIPGHPLAAAPAGQPALAAAGGAATFTGLRSAEALGLLSTRQPAGQAGTEAEKCEICAAGIPAEHGHVADLEQSSLICACRACYLLFTHSRAGRGRYRAIPDRVLADPDHPLSAVEWDELQVPVGLAFFLRSSADGSVTGFYPSPAGVTECRLDLSAWERLEQTHPLLGTTLPDVEALLIYRGNGGVECFLVPIDACYELAGRMRLHWRGFDGGDEARQSIADFLAGLRSRARALSKAT